MNNDLGEDRIGANRCGDRNAADDLQMTRSPLVPEDCSGHEYLRDCIENAGTMSVVDAIAVVDQIAAELALLHRNESAHRSIDPSTIVLTDEGVAKLVRCDLFARAKSSETSVQSSTWTDHSKLEDSVSKRDFDGGADLRGIGRTLYFMVTGRDLSSDPAFKDSAYDDQNRCTASIQDCVDQNAEAADAVFQRLISRDEANRYASIAELRFDLRKRKLLIVEFEREDLGTAIDDPTQSSQSLSTPVPTVVQTKPSFVHAAGIERENARENEIAMIVENPCSNAVDAAIEIPAVNEEIAAHASPDLVPQFEMRRGWLVGFAIAALTVAAASIFYWNR